MEENKIIGGGRYTDPFFDAAIKRQHNRIIEAEKLGIEVFFLTDIESGIPYEVTEEYFNSFNRLFEACKPKIDDKNIKVGSIRIYGTAGDGSKSFDDSYPGINHSSFKVPLSEDWFIKPFKDEK